MTAWVPSLSSDINKEDQEQLRAFIQEGMENNSYVSDDVIKVTYVGERGEGGDVGDGGSNNPANQQQWLYPNAMTIREDGGPLPPPILQSNAPGYCYIW